MELRSPKIVEIELTPIHMPFKKPIREIMSGGQGGLGMAIAAEEEWLGGDYVICKLISDTGFVGLGEVYVWLPETGVSPAQIIDTIQSYLKKYILGESPTNINRINARMNANVARNEVAKGLIDMACYDMLGKINEQPLWKLWAEIAPQSIPLTALVPLTSVDLMVMLAKMYVRDGYKSLRIKLGKGLEEDKAVISAIRSKIGFDIALRVDYNQAYSVEKAIQAIQAIEPFAIEVAEQPINALNFLGMGVVQKAVKTPLMAHEMAFSLSDLEVLIELGGIRAVGINSERPGGITNAVSAIKIANQHEMGVIIHNQTLGIATAMQIHLVAGFYPQLKYSAEFFGDVMLEDDLILQPLKYHRGSVEVPKGFGLGVELDETALDKHRAGETVRIK
jgi:muconate cycloisomerase